MAVNHADGTMFTSVIFYPIAAGAGAFHAGAGWFSVLFAPFGLAIGIGIIYIGRKLVYSISRFGMSFASKMPRGLIQQLFFAPFFLLYVILPIAIVWGGVFGIWKGSAYLVRYVF